MTRILLTLSLLSGACATAPVPIDLPRPAATMTPTGGGVYVLEDTSGGQYLCMSPLAAAEFLADRERLEAEAARCEAPPAPAWYPR